jgi:hypothetical protein
VPSPDQGEFDPVAAGERIVAFARPGKPPGSRFSRQNESVPAGPASPIFTALQRFFRPGGVGGVARAFSTGRKHGRSRQEARSTQISAAVRVDHPRRRLCGAPMRGAGFVQLRRQDHGRRCLRDDRPVAARLHARRQNGAELRSGLASRKIARRQIRQVAIAFSSGVDAGSHSNQAYADCVDLSAVENARQKRFRITLTTSAAR